MKDNSDTLPFGEDRKGCLCGNKKHQKTWHCIIRRKYADKRPDIIRADFPFNNPPTQDTGDWLITKFHLVENW